MNKREIEDAKMGLKTVEDFFRQFGDDVHTQILLEEIFEGVINAESLFIFGEQEQEGSEVDNSSPDGEHDARQLENQRIDIIESPNPIPKKDREDYL